MNNLSDYKYPEFNEDFEGMIPQNSGGGGGGALYGPYFSSDFGPEGFGYNIGAGETQTFTFSSFTKAEDGSEVAVNPPEGRVYLFPVGVEPGGCCILNYFMTLDVAGETFPQIVAKNVGSSTLREVWGTLVFYSPVEFNQEDSNSAPFDPGSGDDNGGSDDPDFRRQETTHMKTKQTLYN